MMHNCCGKHLPTPTDASDAPPVQHTPGLQSRTPFAVVQAQLNKGASVVVVVAVVVVVEVAVVEVVVVVAVVVVVVVIVVGVVVVWFQRIGVWNITNNWFYIW